MGTKVAPTYATLVLGFLEEKLFETLEEKSVNTLAIIYMYVCHGDDIRRLFYIIWDRGEDQLADFVNILNSMSPTS